jgi:hypothetical protein
VVYCCAAVMLFCRVAVNSKTAALQHRNTATQRMTPNALPFTDQDLDIRLPAAGRDLEFFYQPFDSGYAE